MKRFTGIFQALMALVLAFGVLGALPPRQVEAAAQALRISQVYGGGGNSGAPYNQDFVEIFNASSEIISLSGYSIQYASAAGTTWNNKVNLTGNINANSYYLIGLSKGTTGADLPTPDNNGSINMSATAGKVALVNSTTSLSGGCPSDNEIVDFVGFGTAATCFEGHGSTPAPSNTTAVHRDNAGCTDNDDNSADFVASGPTPRNSSSPTKVCTTSTSVMSTFPVNGEPSFAATADIIVEFNQPIALVNGLPFATIKCGSTTYDHALTHNAENTIWTLNPSATLPFSTLCTVSIGKDKVAPSMAADYNFSFTTDPTPPVTKPVVTSTVPVANAVNVPLDSKIVVNFDQRVALVDPWYSLTCGSSPVPSVYEQTSRTQYTITPEGGLPQASNCTFVVNSTKVTNYYYSFLAMAADAVVPFSTVDAPPSLSSSIPAHGAVDVPKDTNIMLVFNEPVDMVADGVTFVCEDTGEVPFTLAMKPEGATTWVISHETQLQGSQTCTLTVPAASVTDLDEIDPPDTMTDNIVITFTPVDGCGDPFIQVYELQGTGSATPYVNQIVTTEGIVVADLQNVGNKRAFYIHAPVWDDKETTSDGIMVYTDTNPRAVTVGDRIRITAKIVELYTITELTPTATDPITVCSSGNAVVPKEVALPWTSADLEPIEGMLVKFTQDLYVNDYYQFDQYGQVTLGSSRHFQPTSYMEPGPDAYNAANALKLDEISLDDGQTAQNPDYLPHIASGRYTQGTVGPVHIFRGGDSVSNLHAIVDYVSGWRFVRVGEAAFNQNNPRTIAPSLVPGEIRVSSINTLNFFKTLNTFPVQNICGPNSDMGCRGANSTEEQDRQIAKTAAAVVGMDADVIGLLELENDRLAMLNDWGADYAIRMIVDKMNDLTTPGLYNYVPTGVIGSDAIKVGIVYRTTNVEPLLDEFGKVKFSLLTSAVDPNFDDSLHRPALAVSFRDKHTDGIFTLAINHLKSKGCGSASGSDADQQDGQSCWNNARTKGANALVKWLETDPNGSGSNLFLIMGDLNSYAKEDPINAIIAGPDGVLDTADDYLDMAARFHVLHEEPGLINYGYVYGAMAGSLDYALANKPLANYVLDAKEWHINADEADVIDYNLQWSATGFKPADQANLYQSDPYRSSDHDPILVSLLLNHSPEAVDDEYYVATNDVLIVEAPGVMANDFDPNIYEAQTVALVPDSGPWNGTLTLNVDGSFVYTPNPDFVGEDSFQYVFSSLPTIQAVNTDTATVTIHVGSPLVVSEADLMLASDMSGPYLKQTGSLPLAYLIEIDPSHVWYYLDVDNVVSNRPLADGMYPFEMGGQVIFYLKVEGTDYTLIDGYLYHSTGVESPLRIDGTFTPGTYTYTGQVKDEIGWPADVSINLIVTNLNEAPVANLDYYTVKAYESLIVPPSGVIENDEDELKPLLVAEVTYNVENGTLSFNPDGSFTYTPNPGFVGLDNFAYRVFDGKSWSDPTAVVITVTAAEFFIYLPLVLR